MERAIAVLRENGGYLFSSDHSVPGVLRLIDFCQTVELAREPGSHDRVIFRRCRLDFDAYRNSYFASPRPEPRFRLKSSFGVTLFYADYAAAVDFHTRVFGPPAYVEGQYTRGWPVGDGWLTLLKGDSGAPANVEIALELETPAEAEALQRAFLAAGAQGPAPSDQLMYRPIRSCPVTDPFGVQILIFAPL